MTAPPVDDLAPTVVEVHRWHLQRALDHTARQLLTWHGPELAHPGARPPAGDLIVCRDRVAHDADEGERPPWPCAVYRSVVTLNEHQVK